MPPNNPEGFRPAPPVEQPGTLRQSPEGTNTQRQTVTPEQRTDVTLDRMIAGLNRATAVFSEFMRHADTPGTPQNKIREIFRRFMGAMPLGPTLDTRANAPVAEVSGHSSDQATQWLTMNNIPLNDIAQIIRTADATVDLNAGFRETDVAGGQIQTRLFLPNGTAREFTINGARAVTGNRTFQYERLSALAGLTGVPAGEELRIDKADTALIAQINEAKAKGITITMNRGEGIRLMFRGEKVAEATGRNHAVAAEGLRTALRTGIERANAAPPPTPTPTPTPTPAPTPAPR